MQPDLCGPQEQGEATCARDAQQLSVTSATVLYIGAVLGPALLIAPGLAVLVAGPASVLAWAVLVVISAPLAATFCSLGVRYPTRGGVTHYVTAAFGRTAGAAAGWCFVTGVMIGAPTMSVVGGQYVTALLGGGKATTLLSAAAILTSVLLANAGGLRATSQFQTAAVGVLCALLLTALVTALPRGNAGAWTPFAPHGYLAVGKAASLLMLCFVGWEAMSSLTGRLPQPRRDLPRAMAAALVVVSALYVALALATVSTMRANATSAVPLADLMSVGLGHVGRQATMVIATLLTFGTVNAYVAGASAMAASLSETDLAPRWFAGPLGRANRRLLLPIAVIGSGVGCLLGFDRLDVGGLVSAASALFVAVYVAGTAAGRRLLTGRSRKVAVLCCAFMIGVLLFCGWFALVPLALVAAACTWVRWRRNTPGAPASSRSRRCLRKVVPDEG